LGKCTIPISLSSEGERRELRLGKEKRGKSYGGMEGKKKGLPSRRIREKTSAFFTRFSREGLGLGERGGEKQESEAGEFPRAVFKRRNNLRLTREKKV